MVRCADCGFLARLDLARDQDRWLEASQNDRDTGGWLYGTHDGRPRVVPACYRNEFDLPKEIIAVAQMPSSIERLPMLTSDTERAIRDEATLQVIRKERECEKWTDYVQNRDAAQHYEELRMLQLEQQQRDLQVRLSEAERETVRWAETLRAHSDDRYQRAQGRSDRRFLGLAVVGLIIGLAAVAATLYPDQTRQLIDQVLLWFSDALSR